MGDRYAKGDAVVHGAWWSGWGSRRSGGPRPAMRWSSRSRPSGWIRGRSWPVLKEYDEQHLAKIALPLGGIGTGTVSLGGRGDLRDWEIMNRPAKGFVPMRGSSGPFFAIFVKDPKGQAAGASAGGPDRPVPVRGRQRQRGRQPRPAAIPALHVRGGVSARAGHALRSGYAGGRDVAGVQSAGAGGRRRPAASPWPSCGTCFGTRPTSRSRSRSAANCPTSSATTARARPRTGKATSSPPAARRNRNEYREGKSVRGMFMSSEGVAPRAPHWGTIALTTTDAGRDHAPSRRGFPAAGAARAWTSGTISAPTASSTSGRPCKEDMPMASLAVSIEVPAKQAVPVTFLLTWHFPNRMTWTPKNNEQDRIGNYYTTQYKDAWDVAEKVAPQVGVLEDKTRAIRPGVLRERSAGGGQGGRPVQPQHAAHADVLPHGGWAVLRLRRMRQPRRLLPRLVHPRVELRAGDARFSSAAWPG